VPCRRGHYGSRLAAVVTIEVRTEDRDGMRGQADRAYVRGLGQRCVMSSVSSLRQAPETDVRDAFDRLYGIVESQSHVTLIAQRDGERAGFLLLLFELPDEVTLLPQAFVAYMAVEPELRGKGVGTALLAAAENEARGRRLPYISLMVTQENEPACRLYERAGYRTERRLLCKPL
jgi:ribosomal protein S18 acetylase RimI-like enzyme